MTSLVVHFNIATLGSSDARFGRIQLAADYDTDVTNLKVRPILAFLLRGLSFLLVSTHDLPTQVWPVTPPSGDMVAYFGNKLLEFVNSSKLKRLAFAEHSTLVEAIKAHFHPLPLPLPPARPTIADPAPPSKRASAAAKRKREKAIQKELDEYKETIWALEHCPLVIGGGMRGGGPMPMSEELRLHLQLQGLMDPQSGRPCVSPKEPKSKRKYRHLLR